MPTTVLEKTIYVAAFATAIALAALTASLPINLRSHQESQEAGNYSDGNIAWTIVATILGFFLSPALAHFYATVHGHDTADTLKYTLVAGSLITFLWVIFTYSLAYGKDAHKNGIYGLPISYYMFHDTFNQAGPLSNVYGSIYAVYELGFALVAATIVISSVASRVNLNGLLAFLFVWHILVYCPMAHIAWANGGAFQSSGRYQDFSGALPVHVLGGITAIVLHLVLGKDTIPKSGPVQNTEKALFGSFVVFFLWFGFNAGKAHAADAVACQSIVNTIAAAMSSVLTGFFYNLIMEKPTNSLSLAQSIIIGLISITSGSGYVTVGGAMCISLCTYLFTVIIAQFILGEGSNLNEPFGVATLHATAGSIGFLWTAIISYKFINPSHSTIGGKVNGALNGLTAGYGMPLGYHIAFLLATWACAFIAVFLIAFIVNLVVPIGNGAIPGDYKAPEAASEEVNKEVQLTQV